MNYKDDLSKNILHEKFDYQTIDQSKTVLHPICPTQNNKHFCSHKNSIIAAAEKLLNIITQIKLNQNQLSVEKLNTDFKQEKNRFEKVLTHSGYKKENILISTYILDTCMSAVTQEAIALSGNNLKINTKSAIFPFNSQRFFVVLEKICKNPKTYIDTIELVYVCLNLVLEETVEQAHYWAKIKDQLYLLIRVNRDDIERKLSPPISEKTVIEKNLKRPLWTILLEVVVSVIFIIGCIYAITGYLFKSYLTPFLKNLQTITQKYVQNNPYDK